MSVLGTFLLVTTLATYTNSAFAASKTTSHPLVIGVVADLTGNNSSQNVGASCAAYGAAYAVNAKGGIDGRQIKVLIADDQSTPAGGLTAAQSLLSRGAEVIAFDTQLNYSSALPYLVAHHVPVVGTGANSPLWTVKSDRDLFNVPGVSSASPPIFTLEGKYLKSQGVTKAAGVGYNFPSTIEQVQQWLGSAKAYGISVVYENTSLTIGAINFPSVALAIKNSGAQALVMSSAGSDGIALTEALSAAGVHLKVNWEAGITPAKNVLEDATAVAALQGATFAEPYAPVEIHSKATEAFQALLSKYCRFTGDPEQGMYLSSEMVDAAITGFQLAAPNFSSSNFINKLRAYKDYTDGGLLAGPTNFSQLVPGDVSASDGTCAYLTTIKGTKIVPLNGGKPACGTPIKGT